MLVSVKLKVYRYLFLCIQLFKKHCISDHFINKTNSKEYVKCELFWGYEWDVGTFLQYTLLHILWTPEINTCYTPGTLSTYGLILSYVFLPSCFNQIKVMEKRNWIISCYPQIPISTKLNKLKKFVKTRNMDRA